MNCYQANKLLHNINEKFNLHLFPKYIYLKKANQNQEEDKIKKDVKQDLQIQQTSNISTQETTPGKEEEQQQ